MKQNNYGIRSLLGMANRAQFVSTYSNKLKPRLSGEKLKIPKIAASLIEIVLDQK